VFISVREADKDLIEAPARELLAMGFSLIATRGTAKTLESKGLPVATINKGAGGAPPCGGRAEEWRDQPGVQHHRRRPGAWPNSSSIRRAALTLKVPYYTTNGGCSRGQPRPSRRFGRALLKSPPCSHTLCDAPLTVL